MARLNVVDPATATGKAKELFDGPLAKKKLNIYRGIANNPTVLDAFVKFAGGVRGGSLTPAQHELVALLCAQTTGCDYCLAAHTKVASSLGVNADAAIMARKGAATDPKNQALLRFATAVLEKKGHVSDQDLKNFRAAGFDDPAVVETLAVMTVNYFTNLFNHVNQTEIDTMFDPAPKI